MFCLVSARTRRGARRGFGELPAKNGERSGVLVYDIRTIIVPLKRFYVMTIQQVIA